VKRASTVALAWLLLGACTTGASVDAAKVLRDGAAAMASLKTVTATMKFTKGAISFQTLTLVSARASVRLPSDSSTVYTVKLQDATLGVEVVITGGHTYLHLPLSSPREVSATEAATLPDFAKLFDRTTGLPAVIPAGTKPAYVSTETVDGVSCYQVTADYTPEQIRGLLAQLNSSGVVHAKIWVGVSDHFIRKAVLSGAFGDGGTDASVEVDMKNFNGDVTITPPPT
jgi:hypothetical protein